MTVRKERKRRKGDLRDAERPGKEKSWEISYKWHMPREPRGRISKACRENMVALVSSLARGKCYTKHMGPRFSHRTEWPESTHVSLGGVAFRSCGHFASKTESKTGRRDPVAGCDNPDPSNSRAPPPATPAADEDPPPMLAISHELCVLPAALWFPYVPYSSWISVIFMIMSKDSIITRKEESISCQTDVTE